MRELVTYIDEGFYKNTGSHEEIIRAKLADFFDGDYPKWIKDKTGLPLNNYVVGLFLAYLCKCFDFKLGDRLVAWRTGATKEPIYIIKDRDHYKANISGTQFCNVCKLDRDIERIHDDEQMNSLTSKDRNLRDRYINVNGERRCSGKYRLCTASFNLRDCTKDLEKILDAVGIDYEYINLSSTGRAKSGGWLVIDDFKNILK